jgi:hypothetical protein
MRRPHPSGPVLTTAAIFLALAAARNEVEGCQLVRPRARSGQPVRVSIPVPKDAAPGKWLGPERSMSYVTRIARSLKDFDDAPLKLEAVRRELGAALEAAAVIARKKL